MRTARNGFEWMVIRIRDSLTFAFHNLIIVEEIGTMLVSVEEAALDEELLNQKDRSHPELE